MVCLLEKQHQKVLNLDDCASEANENYSLKIFISEFVFVIFCVHAHMYVLICLQGETMAAGSQLRPVSSQERVFIAAVEHLSLL